MEGTHCGSTASYRVLAVLRIMTALLFMEHGTQKVLGFPPSTHAMPFHLFSAVGVGGLLELVGGLLVAVGLFTRPTAFVLSGEMAVAYFAVHARRGFFPVLNMGELAVLYCFVFLYLCVAGGGAWSVDDALRRRRETAVDPGENRR